MLFRSNLIGQKDIEIEIRGLSDTVAGRLRKNKMKANGIKVDIKDPYFKIIARQKQLLIPTNLAEEIHKASIEIINSSWNKEIGRASCRERV